MDGFKIGGVFTVEHLRDGKLIDTWEAKNMVVNEGLNHILNVVLHGTTAITTWYVGVFSGNYVPLATVTAATITAASTEFTSYSQATRVEWDEADAGSTAQSITNGTGAGANKATFSITGSGTLYGMFLASASAKSATTGTLFSAARFSAAKVVENGDTLLVTYTVQAASV